MNLRRHKLANGLTILAEVNDAAYFAAYGFFVKAGARDETPEISGVSHFLEHMVFKGTEKRTADQVNLELDELGSSSNARTGEESTIYHSAVLPEFQGHIVELLSDIMRPSLRNDDFETEKKVIIEEIMMYQDQPPYGGQELLMSSYFGTHTLGQSILGTVETVGELTAEQMRNYFSRQYSPGNIAFVASGKVCFDKLIEDVEKYCGGWQAYDVDRNIAVATPTFGFQTLHKENSHLQYIMQLSPGPSTEDNDRFAMRVLTSVLGDDGGSRLFWELLDPGLAESAAIGNCEFLGTGTVMSYFSCPPELAQENLQRLQKIQLSALQGVSQKEVDLAKQKIASQILLASERTESRMFSVGMQWINGLPYKTPAEIAADYKAVTLEQCNAVAHRYPLDQNCTVSVGPNQNINRP